VLPKGVGHVSIVWGVGWGWGLWFLRGERSRNYQKGSH